MQYYYAKQSKWNHFQEVYNLKKEANPLYSKCVMGPLYLCFIVFADDHLARKFVYFTVCLWLLLVGWYKDNRLNKPRQSEVNIWRENVVSSDQFQILNFFVNPNPFESGMGHTTGLHCPVLNYVWYNPWVGDQLCQDIGAYGGERKNR